MNRVIGSFLLNTEILKSNILVMPAVTFFSSIICSFLFYGVVGQDKTWLLAPIFMVNYTLVTIALLRRSFKPTASQFSTFDCCLLPSGSLWLLFLIYGLFMVQFAVVPFESKLVLLFLGSVVGAYFVLGSELTTFKGNRIFPGALIFLVMLAALYGLVTHFKNPESLLWTERYTDHYDGRLASTYICPNHFAHLMQMLLPFCLVLLFIPQSGIYLRILSAYSFLVFLPPLFLTESRAGWLGSIAAIGVAVCLMALRRSKRLFLFLIILVPLCSSLLLFGAWHYSETFQRRAKPVVEFLQQQSEQGVGSDAKDFRPQTWMDTIDMIKAAPLIGHGPGNFRYTFPEHRNRFRGNRIVTGHPHNEYLELIADYGQIGFGIFALAWLYGCLWILVKSLKAEEVRHAFLGFSFLGTAVGTMVHSFFDFQMHVYPNALVFALLAALVVGPLRNAKRSQDSRYKAIGNREKNEHSESLAKLDTASNSSRVPPSHLWLNKFAEWTLAIGFLIGTLFCFQVMGSSYLRALGDKVVEKQAMGVGHSAVGLGLSAERLYQLAVRIDPQNWRAYKGMGNLLYSQRYHCLDMTEKVQLAEQERDWLKKAYEHNPKDPEIVSGLGKSLIFLSRQQENVDAMLSSREYLSDEGVASTNNPVNSQLERGLDLLREACRYRKFNDIYWWTLGVELRKAEMYEEALEVFKIMETIKQTPSSKKNIEWLERQLSGIQSQKSDRAEQLPDLRLKREKMNLSELLDMMDK
jgi:O-antigen ligase